MNYTQLKNQHRSDIDQDGQVAASSNTGSQVGKVTDAHHRTGHSSSKSRKQKAPVHGALYAAGSSSRPGQDDAIKKLITDSTENSEENKNRSADASRKSNTNMKRGGHEKNSPRVPHQTVEGHVLNPTVSSNKYNAVSSSAGIASSPNEGFIKPKHSQRTPHKPSQAKVFEAYWDKEMVQQGLKEKTLIEGLLRINPKNYMDAFVPHPDNQSDIYIHGMNDRNRALNGDKVCVLLYPREEWKIEMNSLADLEAEEKKVACGVSSTTESANLSSSDNHCTSDSISLPEVLSIVPPDHISVLESSVGALSLHSIQTVDSSPNVCKQNDAKGTAKPQKVDHKHTTKSQGSNSNSKPGTPARYLTVKEIQAAQDRSLAIRRLFDISVPEDLCSRVNRKLVRTGKVVFISEKRHSRACSGRIKLMSENNKKTAKFAPSDCRVPRIMVPITECPAGFLERPDDFADTLFIARITEWEETSMLPKGQLMRSLGEAGDIEPETEGLLIEYDIDTSEFSNEVFVVGSHTGFMVDDGPSLKNTGQLHTTVAHIAMVCNVPVLVHLLRLAQMVCPAIVLKTCHKVVYGRMWKLSYLGGQVLECLPKNLPWTIPAKEFEYRRDLRRNCIFTVDPSTARDLDDSLSCEDLGNGIYEIGVHIADVSFFVDPGTELDKIASRRTTSVYLVQKVIPMLPRLLCEQLCSLNPDEDRLTFSVIWKMTSAGDILEEWFGRTVIKSCVKLSYEHAQGFIQEPSREWTTQELPPISEGFTVSDVKQRVLKLHEVAVNLRQKRFEGGALQLNQVKLQFILNKETGLPSGYSVFEQKDSNRLIEEFMLLANIAVAQKLYKSYPDNAVLRRHPFPQSRMMDEFAELCEIYGLDLDMSSSGALQRSLMAYQGDSVDERAKSQILVVLCSKPMQFARYFCTGSMPDDSEYYHYALSVPLYTHFTSPIRRYPDIMVHRLLAASLGYTPLPEMAKDISLIQNQCESCNHKKLAAKRVSDLSLELFFYVFVKECGPLFEKGMVMAVLDHSFDVIILKLGVMKRVYVDKLPVEDHAYQKVEKRPVLTLSWKVDEQHPKVVQQSITVFSTVICQLASMDEPLKWNVEILHPDDDRACCFETS